MFRMRLFVSDCNAAAYNDVIHQQNAKPVMRRFNECCRVIWLEWWWCC